MRVRAYFPVPQNGMKTETFSPQNDRTTELNVNFLLAATVRDVDLLHVRKLQSRGHNVYFDLHFLCISTLDNEAFG